MATERLLTPSKISAWLECAHSLNLRNQVDAGLRDFTITPMNPLAELLADKGLSHERRCLQDFEDRGLFVYHVPGRNPDENFAAWVTRIGNPLEQGYDVIYQMPFVHEGIRGIADFLIKVDEPHDGYATYEPIDAKLTRSEGKPGHVLQLCFYADAIETLTGAPSRSMHLWLGSGDLETLLVEQFRPYWRRVRRQLEVLLEQSAEIIDTQPQPCSHCETCDFQMTCEREWRANDSLVYVANIRQPDRLALEAAGVRTVVQLAHHEDDVHDLHQENRQRLQRQAALQVASRATPDEKPQFSLVEAGDDPVYGHGFEELPEPAVGDVFFDFEGHPFWSPECELMFLAGLHLEVEEGAWGYQEIWAHDLEHQHEMIRQLVLLFDERRQRYPGMHVYHYNHTERTVMERLVRGTESEQLFSNLVQSGLFVDLFPVVRNALMVGTESYGLKHMEKLTDFHRRAGIEQGAGAVVEYESWMGSGNPQLLVDIAKYNADDVEATKALRDWLLAQRPESTPWRDPVFALDEYGIDTDELVAALKLRGDTSPEFLLADLLNYWRRERSANTSPKFAEAQSDFTTLYGNRDYLANLQFLGFETVAGRGDTTKKVAVFTYPEQLLDQKWRRQISVLYTGPGVEHGYGYVSELDREQRRVTMNWNQFQEDAGGLPATMTIDDYVTPREKPGVLFHLAQQLLNPSPDDPVSPVSMELLAANRPRFVEGRGPASGRFRDSLDEMLEWVTRLDNSYVAIQGPPGTGKTYSGAHIIYTLIRSGQRVGITAMSHNAIDNLLLATYEVFKEKGELSLLKAVRRSTKPKVGALEGVKYGSNEDCESLAYNLVAGTTWLFARPSMRPYPVDVLLIDEAGQLALADALASANAAHNLVLLGDPLQLAQVAQAEHPGGSGASVLEHVLGGHSTVPDTDGVFIAMTRRMHPDICRFISNQIYEGRLTSHESCAQQTTEFGTGLRWLEAHHEARSTESPEEVTMVAEQIGTMLGSPWVNQHGDQFRLEPRDFMVVAPYNDQVRLLQQHFEGDSRLAGVQVGTVDKFQGREAPVVFFTMTTSTGEDMPRGPEFLFSRNRLNVAISRARCLAYLVCTEELLNARARSVEEMRLISTLSAFVEYATTESSAT